MEIFLMTSDASKILEVSADTVRLYERTGKLAAIKTQSGVRLFKKQDVDRLARDRARKQTS